MPPKRKLSVQHEHFLKRKKRKTCPGCGVEFVDRHFETHKVNFFWKNKWTCKKSKNSEDDRVSQETWTEVEPNVSTNAFTNEGDHSVRFESAMMVVRQKLKNKLQMDIEQDNNLHSDDENEELWNNVTLDEIDMDFGPVIPEPSVDAQKKEPVEVKKAIAIFQYICIFLCCWQSFHIISDAALGNILSFLSAVFHALTAENIALSGIASLFPCSVYMLYKNLGLQKDNFTKYVICKKCFKLYNYDDCISTIEGEKTTKLCRNVLFPNHRQKGRRNACGEPLLKVVTLLNGKSKLYPYKTYCYKSVQETLAGMVRQPGFEEMCEKWRQRRQEPGIMSDVYDGKIWKEFGDDNKKNFLKSERNYGLMLNLDWFQPFDHVKYSVGVMYAVVLNLPREERFKLKNIFLIGIIPDMTSEPKVQTFISPFVEEMQVAWKTGFSLTSFKSPKTNLTFKMACLCVGCDIPATRKLCGFLGHGATLGCSKCTKHFPGDIGTKNYGGFDLETWTPRSLSDHRKNLNNIKSATTQTDKERLESKYGVRYSPLCDLEYFDPIRMSVIDPMHNFYQGTAKKMIKIWLEFKILDSDKLKEIEQRVDAVNVAANVGSIPRKISSSFGGFTADQWKTWTNIFSVFALKDIIPSRELEVWRKFVLASRCIATKIISTIDILRYEELILQFCREFEDVYGEAKVTPNMHLHCHLGDCIRDYGPIYSFWLFSFERYNGHLGSLPNNNRSIELQIMRRFLRDSFVNSLDGPSEFKETLDKSIFLKEASTGIMPSNVDIYCVIYMAKKNTPISNQPWDNITPYSIPKTSVDSLAPEEHEAIKQMYTVLYPNNSSMAIPMSSRRCNFVFLGNEVLGSWCSRHRRSSYIMAYWNDSDGNIMQNSASAKLTPGIIEKFVIHNLIVQGKSQVHLLAKVKWFFPLSTQFQNYCGEPVEAWSKDIFQCFGPSAFMPIQRLLCRFVQADGIIGSKNVSFVCPLNKGLNI